MIQDDLPVHKIARLKPATAQLHRPVTALGRAPFHDKRLVLLKLVPAADVLVVRRGEQAVEPLLRAVDADRIRLFHPCLRGQLRGLECARQTLAQRPQPVRDSLHRRGRRLRDVIKQLYVQLGRFLSQIGEVLPRHQRAGDVVKLNPVFHAVRSLGGKHQFEAAIVVEHHVSIADVGQDAVRPAAQAVQAEGQVQFLPPPAVNAVAQGRVQRGPVVQGVRIVHEKLPDRRHDLHKTRRVCVLFHLKLRHGDQDAREKAVALGAFRCVASLGQCVHLCRCIRELRGQRCPCLRQFVVVHFSIPAKSDRTVWASSPYSSSE